jgi:hypothetical protein
MVLWKIEDDNGVVHEKLFPGTLYIPELKLCLLSPQSWCQSADDNFSRRDGTWQYQTANKFVMEWDQRKYRRTVPWYRRTNTGRTRSAPGTKHYRAFVSVHDQKQECHKHEHVAYAHVLLNDRTGAGSERGKTPASEEDESNPPFIAPNKNEENLTDFFQEIQGPNIILDDDLERLAAANPQAELLRWHYRLEHTSFTKLKIMSALGILPRRLSSVHPPKYAGCIFGATTKRPWRTKASPSQAKPVVVTGPGDCVYVDQLESSTPGFVAQLKGILKKRRYTCATIFVDHYSRLGCVHMQQHLTSDETVEAKHAFEAFSRSQGFTIKHYHADNGRFADNSFLKDINEARPSQSITYCGVNAHFQNGIAEKRIRDLQEPVRKQLMHAKARWPSAVTTSLWPYALRNTHHMINSFPDSKDGTCPFERFSGVEVAPNLKSNHTFGCPVYALSSKLASGKTRPKWNSRAIVGLYIGSSPGQARNVSLVLSLDTGLVSPQFHVQHDDFFETVSPKAGNPEILSHWQKLSGIRLNGKAEKSITKVIRGSKPTSKETRVEPAASLEPDLFELEQEVPPQVLEEEDIPPVEKDAEPETVIPFGPTLRRSTRTRRPKAQYQQYMEQ